MKIVNISATVEMENPFDLDYLKNNLPNAKKSKLWVKVRIPPYNKYTAFYASGKFLVTGVKSHKELFEVSNNVEKYLNKWGINNCVKSININNYVLTDNMGININLNNLILKLNSYDVSYEPEQFPGLIFKDEKDVTFILFTSSKMNITGVKSLENIEDSINSFKKLIYENL